MRIAFDKYDELLKLKDLKRSRHQRNKHPKEQIERLALIMKEHGVRQPIHVSRQTGEVVFGHGRWEAAKINGWPEFPVVYQNFKDETEEYSCVQSDNAIAAWAELDLSAINMDIGNLGPDFDIDLLGIEGFKLDVPFEAQADEDEVPEHVEPNAKLGDIYQLGRHRLMCGDSTSIDAIDRLMDGVKAGMVFTDPPYGMDFRSNFRTKTPQFRKIENDDRILDIAPILWTVMTDSAAAYICTRWDVYPQWFDQFSNFKIRNCVVWHKRGGGMGDLTKCYSPAHEFIIVAHKGDAQLLGKRHSDVWEIGKDGASTYRHPTQKPVELSAFAIENHAAADGSVLDIFGGSGSTLIACEKTNRTCYMMELDPHYIDVIMARWEKYTGQKADLLERTDEPEAVVE